eukprot:TRINITY_DN14627_c0_g1_i1.p1 TRINITY_DN14627_c0_g1~~TRINITY_DN14627_c0_g1_i1.p1  ORF type:complete len:247 (+),score=49.88 TRINITY_DN14627_c0_g1_i1:64-804(+)
MKFIKVKETGNHWAADPDQEEVKEIARSMWWYSEKFSPKAVPKFYDVSGLTENPKVFEKVIDILYKRYSAAPEGKGPTHIIGYDARGFLFTPLALRLGIPFVLLRKEDKNPGVIVSSTGYGKEYAEAKPDTQSVRLGSIDSTSRVVLIDDLIATGGTAVSGFELVESLGASVFEFAAMISLPFLNGVQKIQEYHDGKFKDVSVFTLVEDSSIPDSACADPKGWDLSGRKVSTQDAPTVFKKYDFPR